jgi:amino acid transporter
MQNDLANYPNLTNPECVWTPVREWGGLPNVKWCEETLCGVISEPANTWSNLAYLFVAIGLFFYTRRESNRMLRFWAPAAFWVGVSSLVYHASVTFVLQVFDFFGMYFFFNLVLLLNLTRLGTVKPEAFFKTLYISIFALTGLTVVLAKTPFPIQGIVVVLLIATLTAEVMASRRVKSSHGALYICLAFIAIAFAFSASDASRLRCDPHDHLFPGHAVWHVFGAVSMIFAHLHYKQFAKLFE